MNSKYLKTNHIVPKSNMVFLFSIIERKFKKSCQEFHEFSLIFILKALKKFATDCTDLNRFFF
jgi:hypothetical protein